LLLNGKNQTENKNSMKGKSHLKRDMQ